MRRNIITPCLHAHSGHGEISYGITSYGYDARLGYELKLFRNREIVGSLSGVDVKSSSKIIDPKNFDPAVCQDIRVSEVPGQNYFDIPPHSFVLGKTMEWFDIPRDCLAICMGKSTFARTGLFLNTTPLEPEWSGEVTLELANCTDHYIRVYPGEGITAVYFITAAWHESLRGDRMIQHICDVSYKDKGGKYQNQQGVTYAKVLGNMNPG